MIFLIDITSIIYKNEASIDNGRFFYDIFFKI